MTELHKRLTLFDLTMIAIGSIIGSGIFITPSTIVDALRSPGWVLGVWVLGGLMGLCGALTYAELGAMMPRSGGIYVYLSEGYGRLFGFLYGWVYFTVVNTGSLAALSLASARYLGYLVPLGTAGTKAVAIGALVLLSLINILGVKAGALFSDLFTLLKVLGILGLITAGLVLGEPSRLDFAAPVQPAGGSLTTGLALAFVGVMWSTSGWHHTTFLTGEARNPRRDVPLAMVIGAVIVTLVYALTNLSYMAALPIEAIAASPRVAADAAEHLLGRLGATLVTLTIFVSTLGTVGIYTLAAPRIYHAMARDGVFFARVASLHPRFGTPAVAIAAQCAWASALVLWWGTFERTISYVVFADAIFFALTAASVFVFRVRRPAEPRPYRTLGYPLVPLLFIAFNTWFVVHTVFSRPLESAAGLGLVLAGVPAYWLWTRPRRRSAPAQVA